MTPKEYLQQYLSLERELASMERRLALKREHSLKITQILNGSRVQNAKNSAMCISDDVIDLENKRDEVALKLAAVRCDVEKTIAEVDDLRYRELLEYYYLTNLTLVEISKIMSYCYQYTVELHGQALRYLALNNIS